MAGKATTGGLRMSSVAAFAGAAQGLTLPAGATQRLALAGAAAITSPGGSGTGRHIDNGGRGSVCSRFHVAKHVRGGHQATSRRGTPPRGGAQCVDGIQFDRLLVRFDMGGGSN
jgi:hypothetical protein